MQRFFSMSKRSESLSFGTGTVTVVAFFVMTANASFAQNIPPLHAGFPKTLDNGSGTIFFNQPAVADLDNGEDGGKKEIIVGTLGRKLYVINNDGQVRAGWPKDLPGDVEGSPAIGLIDGDAFPDIVVGCRGNSDPTGNGAIVVFKRDGTQLWSHPTLDITGDGLTEGVYSTPAIGNVDGIAGNEVVVGSFDMRLYVLKGDGTNLSGWPLFLRDTIWSSPALADMNNDGKLDIIIGVDTHAEGPPFNTPNGGALHVFTYQGFELAGFPKFEDQTIMSSPAVGDIDGDGKPEIVVGGGTFYTGNVGKKVYAYHCNGSAVAGWPVTVETQVFESPALADLNADGKLDVVITDEPSGMLGANLYAFKFDGTQMFKVKVKSLFGTSPNADNPIVADITGDGVPEILVAVNTEIAVFSNTGAALTATFFPGDPRPSYYMNDTATSGAVVADIDNNGKVNVIAGTGTPSPSPTTGKVYVWTPGPNVVGGMPWPMFRQDSARNGLVPGTPACSSQPGRNFFTITPCRLVDTRNPPGPLGGPAMAAFTTRDFQIGGNCGVPLTATAVAMNITETGSPSFGDLRIWPTGTPGGSTSVLNWRSALTRANNAIVSLGSNGKATVWVIIPDGSSVHVILDVFGYFQ